jgi:hypothetical protein
MRRVNALIFALLITGLNACIMRMPPPAKSGTFGYDLEFLKAKDNVVVLRSDDGRGQVIVSPKYQAKVFTSTADGLDGKSFGWINYKTFDAKELDPHMNAYGGEDRLWLGPEGGRFSLFFKPGTKMEFDNWHTPPAIDNESWDLVSSTGKKVSLTKNTSIQNYAGTTLSVKLQRDIEILEPAAIKQLLGIDDPDSTVKLVGFTTVNTITNSGTIAWDKTVGAPCLWSLDMFTPSPQTIIIVPYKEDATGKVATTNYFGEIPKDRIVYNNSILLFRAENMIGSYDGANNVLTIVLFDLDNKADYLNQEWKPDTAPFTGDAVNAYNDGPLANGSQMGPFYELESVSPAAFLKPGEKLSHKHSVFHFMGDINALDKIASKALGFSLHDKNHNF